MADIITTLQNKGGDNVFPIAGGLASNAVTTAMLQSNAVTTAKIDDGAVTDAKLAAGAFLDRMYPVGAIFMSATHSTANAVATALGGGTWVAWGTGRVPVGVDSNDTDFDTSEETGGRKWSGFCDSNWKMNSNSEASQQVFINYSSKYVVENGDQTNMPPYITCYMWKRTA